MIVTKGTQELLTLFYGRPQKRTIKSLVVLNEGKPVGVAGLRIDGAKMVAFTEMTEEFRKHKLFKRTIIRAYREWVKMLPKDLPVYAIADPEIDGSQNLLKHVGFEYIGGDAWRV